MPKEQAHVDIDATPEQVFALLVADRTEFPNNTDVKFYERIGDEPMGVGYRYKSTFLHSRHRCEMLLRVTAYEPPWVLEDEYSHHCEVTKRSTRGSLRYQLMPNGHGTTLIATERHVLPGLSGLLLSAFGGCSMLGAKLQIFASRVEARTPQPS